MQEAEEKLQGLISKGLNEMTSPPPTEDEEPQRARAPFLTMHNVTAPEHAQRAHVS